MLKKSYAHALPLFGKLMVVVADKEENQKTKRDSDRDPMTEEQLQKMKTQNIKHSRERKVSQYEAEKLQVKHLLSFYNNLAEPGIRQDKRESPTLAPATIRKYHALLQSILAKATQWQLIAYNPADKVEPPKMKKTHKEIYDEETTGKFLVCLQDEELKYRLLILLALSTGMRRGELLGLEWSHIDFNASTININQTSQYLPDKGIYQDTTKTEESTRIITAPSSVMELLRQYKVQQAVTRLKLGDKWRPDIPKEEQIIDTERIFTTWNGKPMHPDSFNTWLRKFAIKNDLPHISPQSFRHMTATFLITGGVDLRTVSGKLGHANSTTTQKVYSHLVKSAEKQTADMMESFIQTNTEKAQIKKAQAKKQLVLLLLFMLICIRFQAIRDKIRDS